MKGSYKDPLQKRRRGRCGLTLIEVMIATLLLSMLIVGVYHGITLAVSLTYSTAQHLVAFTLCKEVLEQMRAAPYANVTTTNFPPTSMKLTHLGGLECVPLMCTRSCVISLTNNPIRKNVTVTVAWDYMDDSLSETVEGVIYYIP